MQIVQVCVWVIFCFRQPQQIVRGYTVEFRQGDNAEFYSHCSSSPLRLPPCGVPCCTAQSDGKRIVPCRVQTPYSPCPGLHRSGGTHRGKLRRRQFLVLFGKNQSPDSPIQWTEPGHHICQRPAATRQHKKCSRECLAASADRRWKSSSTS